MLPALACKHNHDSTGRCIFATLALFCHKRNNLTVKKISLILSCTRPTRVHRGGLMQSRIVFLSGWFFVAGVLMAGPAIAADLATAGNSGNAVASSQAQDTGNAGGAPTGTTDQSSDKKQSEAQKDQLGTIVVTANRRSETLQNIALPVSVLSYHDIQRQQLVDFQDYADAIPGLAAVSSGAGITGLSIRGISSGSQQPSASVGVYVDDTPFGSSSVFSAGSELTPDIDPADLERIEVLRGPQGTLYGAGALGGVLRFITIPPDTENYSGRLQVGGSSTDGGGNGFNVHGMVNLPLVTDTLALRANVFDRTDPGFISDDGRGKTDLNEDRVKGGRASLLWTPSSQTSLRITVLAQNLNRGGSPSEALDPVTLKPLYGDLQQRGPALGGDPFDGRYRLYNATLDHDFGWAKLVASSSYSTLDAVTNVDVTPLLFLGPQANGQPYGTLENEIFPQTKTTQEIRLESPKSDKVEWLGGVFYTHETADAAQTIYPSDYYSGAEQASPFGIPIGGDTQPSTYDAWAVYGSLTWHFTDRFDVEAGLRHSHDQQHYTENGYGLLFGSPTQITLLDKHSSDSSNTFSLTPQFHISDNTMLYARAASGFLPGGPNVLTVAIPGVPTTFSPTKLTDYELGLKTTSLDDRLITDLSAYHIDWTKIPLVTFVSPFTFLGNGGQAKANGFEATIAVVPTSGVKLSANVSYNDATLTKDAPLPSNGRRGDPLPYAPKLTYNLNGDYDFALRSGWDAYVGASYSFVDTRTGDFTFDGTASAKVPSYHTLNLRAGLQRDQWKLDFYVKNATNERGIILGGSAQLNPITTQMEDNVVIIPPRTIGVSISRDF
ncbi:MAG: TonB-dependent receptor [Rudaea sp.]